MDYDRLDSGMTQDERGTPFTINEAERVARDENIDIYVRHIIEFLLRRIQRLEDDQ